MDPCSSIQVYFSHDTDLLWITDPQRLASLCTDWRGHYHGKAMVGVEPLTVAALQRVMAYCYQHGISMVPQGGNTGLCGGATPDESGSQLLLSLTRLSAVRSIDADNASIVVEAGCTLQRLQEAAEEAGFLFPLSLAAEGSCQIGGNLSTNAGGVHVVRYGMMRDLVLGLEVVLPDGRLWSGLRALKKDNTGYSLKHLFVGAEGTLGVITAASLKLFPRWKDCLGVWVSLDNLDEVEALYRLFRDAAGERLSAFEVMSAESLQWVLSCHSDRILPAPLKAWTLWIELAETAPHSSLLQWFEDHLSLFGDWVEKMVLMQSSREYEQGWEWRELIPTSEKRAVQAWNYDISVPISRLKSWIQNVQAAISSRFSDVKSTCFGHWGDGNLHWAVYVARDHSVDYLNSIKEPLTKLVFDYVHEYGGSISAEHGLGQLKAHIINDYQDNIERDMMRAIKNAMDPFTLMNPGKVIDNNT
jgi:FAD/FMN-containing dehydrogenase